MSALSEVVTAVVALYGAALSTYTLIAGRRDKAPQIKIELENGMLMSQPYVDLLFLKASNCGNKTVTLNLPCLRLPSGEKLVFPDARSNVQFPYELAPEASCQMFVELEDIKHGLKQNGYKKRVKLVGLYSDAVGRKYTSRPYFISL